MPEDKFNVPGLDIDTFALPAKVVGGDFWDLISFPENNQAVIVIGDVSGKSISGAMVMAVSKGIIASQVQSKETPAVILSSANRLLYQNMKRNMFVALTIAKIDLSNMRMQYAVAGLPFPFLYRKNHGFIHLQTTASQLPLASLSEMTYTQDEVTLQKEDVLLFTTDGLLEAMNSRQDLYGVQQLEEIMKRHHANSPSAIRQSIMNDVDDFVQNTEQFDDMTIVTVKIS
jgi:sigma-B regulation protein RsbU (phosphoserine phosphatase)